MTLSQIEADLYRRLGFATSPAAAVTTRLRAYINETQRQILAMRTTSRLRRATLTCASVASYDFAVLPQAAVRIYNVVDRTNQQKLVPVTLSWIREQDPGMTQATGVPEYFSVVNYSSPVARQPSNASQLLVDSTAAGDTGTAYLESVRTGGYYDASSVTMTGVTAVNLGRSDVLNVQKFYISAAAVGTITLVEDAEGGTVLATIPIGRTFARYTMIQLWPQPSAAVTYHVDVDLHVDDMANANDEPYLPEEFHWLLGCGARAKEYEYKRDFKARGLADLEFQKGMNDLYAYLHHVGEGGTRRRGFSQLGPYYEDGT